MTAMPRLMKKSIKIMVWKIFRGGAMVIQGATFIPESRVAKIPKINFKLFTVSKIKENWRQRYHPYSILNT